MSIQSSLPDKKAGLERFSINAVSQTLHVSGWLCETEACVLVNVLSGNPERDDEWSGTGAHLTPGQTCCWVDVNGSPAEACVAVIFLL